MFEHIDISNEKIEMNCNCTGCLTESIFLNVHSKDFKHTVGCSYRHPNGNTSHYQLAFKKYDKK